MKPAAGGSNQNDAASSSQVRLTDAKTNERARKLAAAGTNQDPSFQECARKLTAYRISRAYVPHLEKVYSNLRQQRNRKPEDKMEDLDVNTFVWRMFMTVTHQAAVHLGNGFLVNVHSTPKSATKNSETIVRCDNKVGQRSERISRYIHDHLTRKILE